MCAEDVCAGEVATSDPWYLWKRVVHGDISMAIWHKGIRSAVLIFLDGVSFIWGCLQTRNYTHLMGLAFVDFGRKTQ